MKNQSENKGDKTPLFDRLEYGKDLALISLSIFEKNKVFLIFPLLSTLVLLLILGSFTAVILGTVGIDTSGNLFDISIKNLGTAENYTLLFIFYLVSHFVVIFFNMGLIHCVLMYFNGKNPKVRDGLFLSISRMGSIILWSMLTATIGFIFQIIENKSESIGAIVAHLFGMIWSVGTFFVVPIVAYENLSVNQAIKQSVKLLKDTWGERVGASFAFGIIGVLIVIAILTPVFIIFQINDLGWMPFLLIAGFTCTIISSFWAALDGMFKAAAYQYVLGAPTGEFEKDKLSFIFTKKLKQKDSI